MNEPIRAFTAAITWPMRVPAVFSAALETSIRIAHDAITVSGNCTAPSLVLPARTSEKTVRTSGKERFRMQGTRSGLMNGMAGVAIFSGSLPATRLPARRRIA